jgi:cbb3-type cytochrome oxidase subunit 3
MSKGKFRVERAYLALVSALLAIAWLAAPLPAFSQSCALCYTQAASSGARMIEALRSGILILIVPPTLMSVAMIFIIYRKRNQFRQAEASDSDPA